ncbi:universal stress protein [Spirochaetota bacterium]
MIGIKRILYSSNLKQGELDINVLNSILPILNMGVEKIVFSSGNPDGQCMDELKNKNIKTVLENIGKISAQKILNSAEKNKASLIIVNLDMQNRKSRSFGIIRKLIRNTDVPVLFIKSNDCIDGLSDKGIFSSIIFATNWTDVSERAFGYLLRLKDIIGILDIVNVVVEKLTRGELSRLKERLAIVRKKCLDEKIDAETHVYAGDTAEEIITAVKDYKGTMLFIGGRTRKSLFKRILKFSSSYKVVEEANVPVFIVP